VLTGVGVDVSNFVGAGVTKPEAGAESEKCDYLLTSGLCGNFVSKNMVNFKVGSMVAGV